MHQLLTLNAPVTHLKCTSYTAEVRRWHSGSAAVAQRKCVGGTAEVRRWHSGSASVAQRKCVGSTSAIYGSISAAVADGFHICYAPFLFVPLSALQKYEKKHNSCKVKPLNSVKTTLRPAHCHIPPLKTCCESHHIHSLEETAPLRPCRKYTERTTTFTASERLHLYDHAANIQNALPQPQPRRG